MHVYLPVLAVKAHNLLSQHFIPPIVHSASFSLQNPTLPQPAIIFFHLRPAQLSFYISKAQNLFFRLINMKIKKEPESLCLFFKKLIINYSQ